MGTSILAGLSGLLAFYSFCGAVLMAWIVWLYRERFYYWKSLTLRDGADSAFNIFFCVSLATICYLRVFALIGYASGQWQPTPFNIHSMWPYAVLTLMVMGKVFWLSVVIFGEKHFLKCWASLMLSGLFFASVIAWKY